MAEIKTFLLSEKLPGQYVTGKLNISGDYVTSRSVITTRGLNTATIDAKLKMTPDSRESARPEVVSRLLQSAGTMEPNEDNEHPNLFEALINDITGGIFYDTEQSNITVREEAIDSVPDSFGQPVRSYEDVYGKTKYVYNTEPGSGKFEWVWSASDTFIDIHIVLIKELSYLVNAIVSSASGTQYGTIEITEQSGEMSLSGNRLDSMGADARNRTRVIRTDPNPNITPGEELRLLWNIKSGSEAYSNTAGSIYFDTPTFTGGQIVSGSDFSYVVNVHGQEVTAYTMDYSDPSGYCILLKQGALSALNPNVVNYGSEYSKTDIPDMYRIVPITINGVGVDSCLSYGTMESFGINYQIGTILAVDYDTGIINVSGVGNCTVCYDCGEGGNGVRAFAEDDQVIVIDNVVLGFPDRRVPCTMDCNVLYYDEDPEDPIPGALVYLDGEYVGTTGEDGRVLLTIVRNKEYTIKFVADGFPDSEWQMINCGPVE